jgi:hypothetical protein
VKAVNLKVSTIIGKSNTLSMALHRMALPTYCPKTRHYLSKRQLSNTAAGICQTTKKAVDSLVKAVNLKVSTIRPATIMYGE